MAAQGPVLVAVPQTQQPAPFVQSGALALSTAKIKAAQQRLLAAPAGRESFLDASQKLPFAAQVELMRLVGSPEEMEAVRRAVSGTQLTSDTQITASYTKLISALRSNPAVAQSLYKYASDNGYDWAGAESEKPHERITREDESLLTREQNEKSLPSEPQISRPKEPPREERDVKPAYVEKMVLEEVLSPSSIRTEASTEVVQMTVNSEGKNPLPVAGSHSSEMRNTFPVNKQVENAEHLDRDNKVAVRSRDTQVQGQAGRVPQSKAAVEKDPRVQGAPPATPGKPQINAETIKNASSRGALASAVLAAKESGRSAPRKVLGNITNTR